MNIPKMISNEIHNIRGIITKSTLETSQKIQNHALQPNSLDGLKAKAAYNHLFVNKSTKNTQDSIIDFIENLKTKATDIISQEWELPNGKKQFFQIFNGTQQGSNKGFYALNKKTDELFYVKFPNATQYDIGGQAKTEIFTSKVYEMLGLNVPQMQLIKTPDGKVGTISKFIPNLEPIYKAEAKLNQGFGADIFLANWDAVISNNAQKQGGLIYRINFGGTLNYRAQGKTKEFDIVVDELTSMLDFGINPESAKLFSNMGRKDLIKSLENVVNIDENKLQKLADECSIEPYIFETLIKRKEYLSYVLEIIKKTPSDTKIDLEFLKKVKQQILLTPLEEFETYRLKNKVRPKKQSIFEILKSKFTNKENGYTSLTEKMLQQREEIQEYFDYGYGETNIQCLKNIKNTYGQMNFNIRHGEPTKTKHLDYILENSKIPENATLYRGATPYDFGIECSTISSNKFLDYFFKKGEYFKIPIYPNTSLNKNIVLDRFGRPRFDGKIIYKIKAPKGTQGIYMENIPGIDKLIGNEEEVLLNKDLVYKFKNRTKYFGRDIVEIDLVQQPPKNVKIHDFAQEIIDIQKADKI